MIDKQRLQYIFSILTLCFHLAGSEVYAQVVITGVVHDALTGAPLSEATVQEENGFQATVTNPDGRFEIAVGVIPTTLKISRIGYSSQQLLITQEVPGIQNILLIPSIFDLDPVIVTCQG